MRRNAGSFIRRKLDRLSMLGVAGAAMAMGLGIGLIFYGLFPLWIGFYWGAAAYIVTAVALLSVVRLMERPSYRWNFDNLRKGEDAETRVGQIIEYAITGENCAVAHSVTEIAKVGDIDHIVATPKSIWVIEAKYKRVPTKYFPEVLSRIAANTVAVREWARDRCRTAPPPVRGCLVLAYENKIGRRNYPVREEKIAVFTADGLGRKMRLEARGRRSLDERIAKDIWKLGHIDE